MPLGSSNVSSRSFGSTPATGTMSADASSVSSADVGRTALLSSVAVGATSVSAASSRGVEGDEFGECVVCVSEAEAGMATSPAPVRTNVEAESARTDSLPIRMKPVLMAAPIAMAKIPMTATATGPRLGKRRGFVLMAQLTGARGGLALLIASMAATGCGSNEPTPPGGQGASVGSVVISADSVRLVVGGTTQLTAQVKAADGTVLQRTVVWTSSAPNVAEVSTTGLVTARDLGTAVITATSDGKAATSVATSHVIRSTREYREWFPRVVDPTRPTDVVLTLVADASTDRVQLTQPDGSVLALAKLPSTNAYGLTIRSDRLLGGYG